MYHNAFMSELNDQEIAIRLETLLGRHFILDQQEWLLLHVLREQRQLVLSRVGDKEGPIQPDQYGQPARRRPETRLVAISGRDPESYSDELEALLRGLKPA